MVASARTESRAPRRIAILGSTGSIGRQTLDVIRAFPERFQVVALAAHSNAALLAAQAREFVPELVVCTEETPATHTQLDTLPVGTRVVFGVEGLREAAALPAA